MVWIRVLVVLQSAVLNRTLTVEGVSWRFQLAENFELELALMSTA